MTPSSPNYQSCRESRCGSEKGEGVNQKKEPKQTKEESVALGILVLGGLWLWANRDSVGQALDKTRTVVLVVVVVVVVVGVVWWVWSWRVGRLRRIGGTGRRGRGWDPEGRAVIAVVPVRGGGRRRGGAGPGLGRGKGDPVMDFWRSLLRTAGDLNTASRRVIRVAWSAHEGDGLVWSVSVDHEIKRSVERRVDLVWPEHKIEPLPLDDRGCDF